MNTLPKNFHKNVFINCPYDDRYFPMLKVMIFTIRQCGFIPRIASERLNSAEVRLEKISEIILACKYGVHDLSRVRVKNRNDFARMNMPLELGLDLGCRAYHGNKAYRKKQILILEAEQFAIQKALSDLSFADCKTHHGSGEELCFALREWFIELGNAGIPPASVIWNNYNAFWAEVLAEMAELGYRKRDIERLSIAEYMDWIDWEFGEIG